MLVIARIIIYDSFIVLATSKLPLYCHYDRKTFIIQATGKNGRERKKVNVIFYKVKTEVEVK